MSVFGTTAKASIISSFIFAASTLGLLALLKVRPLVGLVVPSDTCIVEVAALALVILLLCSCRKEIVNATNKRASFIIKFLARRVDLPLAIRALALLAVIVGIFVFAFWAAADVLGGYNGYGYSFSHYAFLPLLYNAVGLDHLRICSGTGMSLSCPDVGNQVSLFLFLAVLGFAASRLDEGVGRALTDSITLFTAPILITFEFALWYSAPQDMSWHVTDYLSIGGVADGGYRTLGGGGSYLISNWLVLWASLFLVASMVPWRALGKMSVWALGRGRSWMSRTLDHPS